MADWFFFFHEYLPLYAMENVLVESLKININMTMSVIY